MSQIVSSISQSLLALSTAKQSGCCSSARRLSASFANVPLRQSYARSPSCTQLTLIYRAPRSRTALLSVRNQHTRHQEGQVSSGSKHPLPTSSPPHRRSRVGRQCALKLRTNLTILSSEGLQTGYVLQGSSHRTIHRLTRWKPTNLWAVRQAKTAFTCLQSDFQRARLSADQPRVSRYGLSPHNQIAHCAQPTAHSTKDSSKSRSRSLSYTQSTRHPTCMSATRRR
jgi:hypothetical protein